MKTIGIIGMGNLGTHLTRLMCRNKLQYFLTLSDKNPLQLKTIVDDVMISDTKNTIQDSDIIFITVKPNCVKSVCSEINDALKNTCRNDKIIVSSAAGVPTNKINSWLNRKHKVVRFMPNIPISIGEGSIVWYSDSIGRDDQNLLNTITEGPSFIWVKNEYMMDPATVIFGCGPAYVAKTYETYVNMGIEMGFPEKETRTMLRDIFEGTSKLLSDNSSKDLMEQVASKGGATEKGLEQLDKDGFGKMIRKSLFSSLKRINKITKSLD